MIFILNSLQNDTRFFSKSGEPILIHQILIGFRAILEITIPNSETERCASFLFLDSRYLPQDDKKLLWVTDKY